MKTLTEKWCAILLSLGFVFAAGSTGCESKHTVCVRIKTGVVVNKRVCEIHTKGYEWRKV